MKAFFRRVWNIKLLKRNLWHALFTLPLWSHCAKGFLQLNNVDVLWRRCFRCLEGTPSWTRSRPVVQVQLCLIFVIRSKLLSLWWNIYFWVWGATKRTPAMNRCTHSAKRLQFSNLRWMFKSKIDARALQWVFKFEWSNLKVLSGPPAKDEMCVYNQSELPLMILDDISSCQTAS